MGRRKYTPVVCPHCGLDVSATYYARHLKRRHVDKWRRDDVGGAVLTR